MTYEEAKDILRVVAAVKAIFAAMGNGKKVLADD